MGRFGVRQLMTVGCQRQKMFQLTDQTFVGLAGLATDVQTMSQLLDFRIKLFGLREERAMQPKTVGNLISSMLYEKRFGPWFTEPVVGVCESFWRPGMDKDELFETLSQCLLSAVDRDCLAGWGGVVHVITPDEIITKTLKGRMD